MLTSHLRFGRSPRFISNVNKEILCSINRERTLFFTLEGEMKQCHWQSILGSSQKHISSLVSSKKSEFQCHLSYRNRSKSRNRNMYSKAPSNHFLKTYSKSLAKSQKSEIPSVKNSECKFQTCIQKFLLQRDQTSSAHWVNVPIRQVQSFFFCT